MTPALAPGPRFDPAAPRWSPLQSLVPTAPASWHPVLFPCPPDKNCDRPRWPVLTAPESHNSSCAHASESACARPLLPAFADALEPDFACDVCLAPHRPYPTASRLPIAHRTPASLVPTARPLLRRTNLPKPLPVGAAALSLGFLPAREIPT